MLLQLQKYNLQCFKKDTTIFLAGTLSRAHLLEVNACNHKLSANLEEIDHTALILLAISKDKLTQIRHASADDPVLQQLRGIIQQGWPECKKDVPPSV